MNDTTQNESFKTNSGRNNTCKLYTHIMSSMFMTQSKTCKWSKTFGSRKIVKGHHATISLMLSY